MGVDVVQGGSQTLEDVKQWLRFPLDVSFEAPLINEESSYFHIMMHVTIFVHRSAAPLRFMVDTRGGICFIYSIYNNNIARHNHQLPFVSSSQHIAVNARLAQLFQPKLHR